MTFWNIGRSTFDHSKFCTPPNYSNYSDGRQNLEQLNVKWPILQTSEISNIKRTNDESFDFIIFDFKKKIYICLNYSNTQINMIIYSREIRNLWNFGSFTNLKICYFPKLQNYKIFQSKNFGTLQIKNFWNLQIWHFLTWKFLKFSK